MTNEQKFWSKIDKNGPIPEKFPHLGPCWIWTAGRSDTGYGTFCDTVTKKRHNAHRFSWILHNGPVHSGLRVLHKCDVRECCRPDHLFLGTQKDNIQDALAKGKLGPQAETFKRLWREKWAGVRCGANIHCSKLNDEQVRQIRTLYDGKEYTCERLGKMFGVSFRSIYDVVMRKTWKHVE